MREGSLDGGGDVPVVRVSRGDAGSADGPTRARHAVGGSAAIVVEVLLVPLLLLVDCALDRGMGATQIGHPANLPGPHHAGTRPYFEELP